MGKIASVISKIFKIAICAIVLVSWYWGPKSFYLLFFTPGPTSEFQRSEVTIGGGLCMAIFICSLVGLYIWADEKQNSK